MKLANKVVVVTGAGGGIGRALALELLERGAKVAAVDIRQESLDELKELAEKNEKNLSTHILDITDQKAVAKFPEEVIKGQGAVDGIINNAGIIQPFVRINDLEFDAIERVMNINFYGTLYMVKAFLPHLLKREHAHIVNVSSMGGFLPVPGQSVYGASKAAVKLLTEALYAELKDTSVRVSVVFPGATETNITANSGVASPVSEADAKKSNIPMLSPKEAAKIMLNGIEKDEFQIYTGKDSNAMNLLCRVNPKFATNFIAKQMKSLLG